MGTFSFISSNDLNRGFTVIELTVVIIVIGILTAATVATTFGYQASARNSERSNDIDAISRSFEQYYRSQPVSTGATYPSTASTTSALATIVGDPDLVIAPQQSSNSIVVATNNSTQTPTTSQYIYQPLNVDGSLCTATPCVRYRLFYQLETSNTVVVKNSLRQQ